MRRNPFLFAMFLLAGILACQASAEGAAPSPAPVSRLEAIPAGAVKVPPADDLYPPAAAAGWSSPEPLAGPINTAGGEDSPFITQDGQSFYFFFTPDVNISPEETLLDRVTGIWVSRLGPDGWGEPEPVQLGAPGETHLDGCETVIGERMYFCSIRAGNLQTIDWWIATWRDGAWGDIHNAGEWFNGGPDVGELHITGGYRELYFGSRRAGGYGLNDLWVAPGTADGWDTARNLGPQVNTTADESRPFVTSDGKELWFNLQPSRKGKPGPAVVRCLRQADDSWANCEEIVSSFAGEPTLSADGATLYFVHHFYSAEGRMIEVDIYVSHRL